MEYIRTDVRHEFLRDKNDFFENLVGKGRLNVFYTDMRAEELVMAIRFLRKNTNVGMVCIDYMQLLKMIRGPQMRQEALKEICLMLKDAAVDTGLPIMLAAQFNRTVLAEADLSPTNIREAGDIEQIANLILGLWNRNFEGFSRDGNVDKNKNKVIKESAIYLEILKGRGITPGHSTILEYNGNSGKLTNRLNFDRSNTKQPSIFG